LSNVYFLQKETVKGTLVAETPKGKVIVKRDRGINPKDPEHPDVVALPCHLLHLDVTGDDVADVHLIASAPAKLQPVMPKAEITPANYAVGQEITVKPRATAYLRAIVKNPDGTYECKTSRIIPFYIGSAMPSWFGILFLLTLLAAAMSTLSSQFHAVGTSIGRDVYEQVTGQHGRSVGITRIGIVIGIIIAVIISYMNPGGGYIIARATAIFFGLCASAFLPAFVGGLFFKRVTRPAAKASIVVGFAVTALWLLFIKDKEARALGICKAIFDKHSLLLEHPNWPVVDPLFVALPLSLIVLIVVTLITKPPSDAHLAKCFHGRKA
jgi:SSS family solute:Na+ symporter